MANTQKDDIAQLKTDVAVLTEQMKNAVTGIGDANKKLDTLNYVSKEEYLKDHQLLDARLSKVEKVIEEGAPARLISKEVWKFVLMAIGIVVTSGVTIILARIGIKSQ